MTTTATAAAGPTPAPAVAPPVEERAPGSLLLATALARLGRTFAQVLASVVVIVVLWYSFLKAFHLNPLVAKDPKDVYHYLFTVPKAHDNRHVIFTALMQTLGDALAGYLAGTIAAIVVAVLFVLYRPVEQAFLPVAMVLRSVPLVAMTPIIALIFGRGLMSVTIIAGIVTFFPVLVNVSLALRSAPKAAVDLCQAYGASPVTTLRKVQVPTALPALFASLRIAAPLALVGALLAEWLATGKGLGYSILQASALSDYSGLWARVVLVTMYSVLLYKIIGGVEVLVLRRFSPARGL